MKTATMALIVILAACRLALSADQWITDAEGRALILHGLNLSNAAKAPPDYTSWHTAEDYARMRSEWGFNVIRLLIFWAAIEPEPGVYDEAYLDRIVERVGWARSLGLHVILDMHQDLYGEKFGDGAPEWATRDDGLPFERVDPWWLNYLAPAVRRSFASFWGGDDLRAHYAAAWRAVAARFAADPAVLGYDLMNEPFFGEAGPAAFEREILRPFYLDVIAAIRGEDPDHWCFYEPEIMTSSGLKSALGVLRADRLAYAPHFYHPLVHEGRPYNGDPGLIRLALGRRDREARRADAPWLLTEFGVSAGTAGMGDYLLDQLDVLDACRAGWTYYSYDRSSAEGFGVLDPEGNESGQLQHLVRPYPQRVAGTPLRYGYDACSRTAYLRFEQDPSVTAPTVFWIGARRIYPEGFDLRCSDPDSAWSWTYDEQTGLAEIRTDPARGRHLLVVRPAAGP